MSIIGAPTQYQVLGVDFSIDDLDGVGEPSFRWERSSDGVNWAEIANATDNQLVLTENLVGSQLRVIAQYIDGRGTLERISSAATSTVVNINDSPVVTGQLVDLRCTKGIDFTAGLSLDIFVDPDVGDVLTYQTNFEDGSSLPSWLVFDWNNRVVHGTLSTQGIFSIRVTATDAEGLVASDVFLLTVESPDLTLNGTELNDFLVAVAAKPRG